MNGKAGYGPAFLSALLVGSLGIASPLVAKSGLSPGAMIFPMVVMGIYCGLLVRWKLLSEESGDSFYYLGFAFTLVALLVALYGFQMGTHEKGVDPVIRAFGVALTTTVIGLVGRVILLSFVDRGEDLDPDEEAHSDAMMALGELRGEVRETVRILSDWRTEASDHWRSVREQELSGVKELIDTLQESLSEQVSKFDAKLEENTAGLAALTEQSIGQLRSVGTEASEQLGHVASSGIAGIGAASDSARGEIQGSFRGIAANLEAELRESQDAASQAVDGLDASISRIGRAAEGLASQTESVTEGLSTVSFDPINRAINQAEASVVEGFTRVAGSVTELGDQIRESFPGRDEYQEVFEALRASLDVAVEQNRDSMQKMNEAAGATGRLFAQVGTDLQNVGTTIGFQAVQESVNELANSMATHRTSLESTGQALSTISSALQDTMGTVRDLAGSMAEMAKEIRADQVEVGELRRELSEARGTMADDIASSQRFLKMTAETITEGVGQIRSEIRSKRPN